MPPITRLEAFIRAHHIHRGKLAAVSGYARQYLVRVRKGTADPTRACMVDVAKACSKLLDREVVVEELFDLGDPPPATLLPMERAEARRRLVTIISAANELLEWLSDRNATEEKPADGRET